MNLSLKVVSKERCSRVTGNAQIVEKKSPSFPLNQTKIDLSIVEIAGPKEGLKDEASQRPAPWRVFALSKNIVR